MARKKEAKKPVNEVVARNRRARFDYHLEMTVEAGIALQGTEVKTLRARQASIEQSWARINDGEVWLVDANIPEYLPGSWTNHAPNRKRKLLLHRAEIRKLEDLLKTAGHTLVPLEVYFTPKGIAKILLAVATGKKHHDKREALAKKDAQREMSRAMRRK